MAKGFHKELINQEVLATILVSLFFIQDQTGQLSDQQAWIKHTLGLTKFNLLWQILSKSHESAKITMNDALTILAAILDCQVPELINFKDQLQLVKTSNPLLFREKDSNKLVFQNFKDL